MIFFLSQAELPSKSAESIYVMKMVDELVDQEMSVQLILPRKNKFTSVSAYNLRHEVTIRRTPWLNVKGKVIINALMAFLCVIFSKCKSKKIVYSRSIECAYFSSLCYETILDIHTPQFEDSKLSMWFFKKITSRKKLKNIIVLTDALKQYVAIRFPDVESKIIVASDASERMLANKSVISKGEKLDVGYTGHLYDGKGIELIVEVAKILPSVNFHIVGGTDYDIARWTKSTSFISNLIFHGYVEYREIGNYLYGFDILLLPNQREVKAYGDGKTDIGSWTSPMKAFEYMATRKPIVVSDVPILREVFSDNINCIMCAPDAPDAWARAIVNISENKQLASSIGNCAYDDFILKYTWESRIKKIFKNE